MTWAFFLALKIALWWLLLGAIVCAVMCIAITVGKRRSRLLLALALCACQPARTYPVYATPHEAPIFYIAPGGAHVPLSEPIERVR